jgi:hypothetical protein
MICGAKTRGGSPCKKTPIAGRSRCRLHGGASLAGEKHWNFKHGWYTKESRSRSKEINRQLRNLELLMIRLGMIE